MNDLVTLFFRRYNMDCPECGGRGDDHKAECSLRFAESMTLIRRAMRITRPHLRVPVDHPVKAILQEHANRHLVL